MTKQDLAIQYDQFQSKWINQKPDFDGWYGSQCVDLIQFWNQLLGGKPFTGNFAYELRGQVQNIYTWIDNSLTAKTEKGDIVVWSQGFNGWAGHTALANGNGDIEGDNDWFEAFSVNDPTGSPAIIKKYSYNYVVGWLRPKTENTAVQTPSDNITRKSYFFDRYWHAIYGDAIDTDKVTEEQLQNRINEAKSEKYRGGEWDKLCKIAKFQGNTSSLTAQSLYNLINNKENLDSYCQDIVNNTLQKLSIDIQHLISTNSYTTKK